MARSNDRAQCLSLRPRAIKRSQTATTLAWT
jgi:hypothetical protein